MVNGCCAVLAWAYALCALPAWPVYMAVAGLVVVVALIVGVLMMTDHRSGRGVIFIVAAVVAVIVAVFAPPEMRRSWSRPGRFRLVQVSPWPG